MITFKVNVQENVTPKTQALMRAYERGAHRKVMAASGAKVVKEHFADLDRKRHRSASKFHFYARAARSTKGEVRGKNAVVNIDHEGIALRYHGGTVRPRVAKYLTIPVDDAAIGKRVGEFSNVQFIINRRTGKGVATVGGRVLFALTKKATHKPDPGVLPTADELLDRVTDDLKVWTELQEDRANG